MKELTPIEKRAYNFIKKVKEIQTNNIADRQILGALSKLKNLGLVEVFKKRTSQYKNRKKKFVRIKQS